MAATLDKKIMDNANAAWTRLHELTLLPTPEHYAVLFAYFTNRDMVLVQKVDEALGHSAGDSNKLSSAFMLIHEKFLSPLSQEKMLKEVGGHLDDEIKQVLDIVSGLQKGQDAYGKSLDSFGSDLEKQQSVEQLKGMVLRMAQETKEVAQQNTQLQQQLQVSIDQVNELRKDIDSIELESLRDPLTGIGNRRAFTADLVRITNEANESGDVLSLIMVDIDFFKKFNDKYGHLIGDQVLKLVAHTMKESLKGRDSVARWGGEEFALLLPQTKLEDAVKVADNLRKLVATKKIIRKPNNEDLGTITLSMGVTQFIPKEDPNDLVERADGGLYRAKQEGRNQVIGV